MIKNLFYASSRESLSKPFILRVQNAKPFAAGDARVRLILEPSCTYKIRYYFYTKFFTKFYTVFFFQHTSSHHRCVWPTSQILFNIFDINSGSDISPGFPKPNPSDRGNGKSTNLLFLVIPWFETNLDCCGDVLCVSGFVSKSKHMEQKM